MKPKESSEKSKAMQKDAAKKKSRNTERYWHYDTGAKRVLPKIKKQNNESIFWK